MSATTPQRSGTLLLMEANQGEGKGLQAALRGDLEAMAVVYRALSSVDRLRVFRCLAVEPHTAPELRRLTSVSSLSLCLEWLSNVGLIEQIGGVEPRQWAVTPGAVRGLWSLAPIHIDFASNRAHRS